MASTASPRKRNRNGRRLWWIIGGVICILMGMVALSIPAIARIEEDIQHGVIARAQPAVAD